MKSMMLVMGMCCVISMSSTGLYAQARQRQVQARAPLPRDRREDVRDRREDVRDRREDVRDRREDVRDRRENVIDRREDVRDARRDGGVADRREDIRDRREDVVDRREDVRDRREDVRDRREDVRDRLEDRIDRHPAFSARLHGLLPADIPPRDAIAGFKNEGQFIAALHVSQNLNIPFRQLKAKVTGDDSVSLGSAIHDLRPDLSEGAALEAAARAEAQAQETENLAD